MLEDDDEAESVREVVVIDDEIDEDTNIIDVLQLLIEVDDEVVDIAVPDEIDVNEYLYCVILLLVDII